MLILLESRVCESLQAGALCAPGGRRATRDLPSTTWTFGVMGWVEERPAALLPDRRFAVGPPAWVCLFGKVDRRLLVECQRAQARPLLRV